MKKTIKASKVEGEVKAPPSKSQTHRAVICAALADGKSKIINPLLSDDTEATIKLCNMLGTEVKKGKHLLVKGTKELKTPDNVLDCGGSGTTLRLFTAISALAPGISILTGDKSLRKRPVGELLNALKQLGVNTLSTRENGLPPIVVPGGGIGGGLVKMRGDISSQFLSALLFACPRALGRVSIELTSKLQSKPYVEMTLEMLEEFGIEISVSNDLGNFAIQPQDFKPRERMIEGDFSSAAFMLSAGALTGKLKVSNLNLNSKQGDRSIIQILKNMGAVVGEEKDSISVEKSKLKATVINASQTPDLVPICAVLATQAKGITKITNAKRLRLKESDRLASTTTELKKMGANIRELDNALVITGPTNLRGASIDPHNDHRIAMACAVAGLVANGETVIENIECISKSYPAFVEDMKSIGVDLK